MLESTIAHTKRQQEIIKLFLKKQTKNTHMLCHNQLEVTFNNTYAMSQSTGSKIQLFIF